MSITAEDFSFEDRTLPDNVRQHLAERLFASPLFSTLSMLNGALVGFMAWFRSEDTAFLAILAVSLLATADRAWVAWCFWKQRDRRTPAEWVRRFVPGAWAYSLAIGMAGFFAIRSGDPYLTMAGAGACLATLVFVLARYSTHLTLLSGQILLVNLPTIVGMFSVDDSFFIVHGILSALFMLTLFGLARLFHRNIVSLLMERENRDRLLGELREKSDALALESKAKSDFLANMSHELRTPLNAIIGFSEMIYKSDPSKSDKAKHPEWAEIIHESGMHLLSLINDILDLARFSAGRKELEECTFDLTAACRDSIKLMTASANAGRVSMHAYLAPGIRVRADHRRIRQVLLNLLSNAVKFTLEGGRVSVYLREAADGSGRIEIEITDTGIGIRQEDIPKVMEMFGRVESSWNRKSSGSDIGLPLIRLLVEEHGGTFELKSTYDVGTQCIVRLPASRRVAVTPERVEPERVEVVAMVAADRPMSEALA